MTQVAIRKLVADIVATALEAQATMMANTNNPNRNSGLRRTPIARKCTYEKFMSCQPFYFNGTEGAVGLIRWFKRTESVFSHSNYAKKNKVKFAINTLTEEALFWWNSFAQPIGVKEAYKITWFVSCFLYVFGSYVVKIERGLPSSGGRGVKQKKNVGKHVVISSSLSNDDTVRSCWWEMLGTLETLNVDGQASTTDPFPCFSNTFGTLNTNTKVDTDGTSGTPSNNEEDGLVNTRCSTCKVFDLLDRCPKKTVIDVNVKTQMEVVRGLYVFPKSHLVYKLVQTTTAKKMDNRQAKQKDTNSNKGIGVAPSNFFNSKSDDVNLGNSKNVNLDNENNDSDDDVEDEDNETSRFMASKSSKGAGSSKSGCKMRGRVYMSVGKMITMITLMAMMRNAKT
uniref:Reverse transcriptase domain-containing protein n=1 Tax=Tanacetum cinerariifolium TaxID=118510 RepID=A0A6L2M287_TANCI|nr:reverse transcriptase domain-containing protein [Tanacetum cinerariifolium]